MNWKQQVMMKKQQAFIKERLDYYFKLREFIRHASGEKIDLKAYEADMRYLIDTYIQADPSVVISPFSDMSLLEVIVKSGIAEAINSLPKGTQKNEKAISETIENNVRSKITEDYLLNPAYFAQMSTLLDEIIQQRKKEAIDYAGYLKQVAELAKKVMDGQTPDTPDSLDTLAKRALYHNLGQNEALALQVDTAVKTSKQAMWRDNIAKENVIKAAIYKILNNIDEVNRIFEIIKQQQEY